MNKEKIVGLSDRLNEIVDEANRHPNGTPGFITWDKAVYAIEALSKEVNSKIIMPAIFDSWYKEQYDRNFNIPNKIIENYAKIFYGDIEGNDDLSHKLMLWVAEYTYDGLSDTLCRQWREKLLKGIDAIMNGYEVEK